MYTIQFQDDANKWQPMAARYNTSFDAMLDAMWLKWATGLNMRVVTR